MFRFLNPQSLCFALSVSRLFSACALTWPLVACSGSVGEVSGDFHDVDDSGGVGGEGSTPMAGGTVEPFRCDAKSVPQTAPMRRLTDTQFRNTIADLLTIALKDATKGASALNEIRPTLANLPADEREQLSQDPHGSYRRLDQTLQDKHVYGYYQVAKAMAAALTNPQRLGVLVGTCASDAISANDAGCLDDFIKSFGARVLRRPLVTSEVDFYRGFYGSGAGVDPAGVADVIAALLLAPQFLYLFETAAVESKERPGMFALTPHELANRLSYHFWQTLPDESLWQAANTGELMKPDVYAKQVERLFRDEKTRSAMNEFYRDYLKLEDLEPLNARNTNPVFKAFAGADLPSADLREAMFEDVVATAAHFTWDVDGRFDDLLTTSLTFAKSPALAKIYGIAPWNGTGSPPAFPDGQRPGLFTRAAFLATGSANTRPIMKGVFLRRSVMCDEIPPPPSNANAMPPALDPKLSTRQVVEALTEREDTTCPACHKALINPLGFVTENFDSLGRLRTAQKLLDDKGAESATVQLDTNAVPMVVEGDKTSVSTAAELMSLIDDSGKAHACFARNYFRFTYGRWEDLDRDGCALERLRSGLVNKNGSLAGMLRDVALSPEFQHRSFQ